jgi:hypothetical protein
MAASVPLAPTADRAVEMGPRNRRRLTAGSSALVLVAALAFGVLQLTRSPGSPGSSGAAHSTTSLKAGHLVYGMTPRQVERLAGGEPTTIRGDCWFYKPKAGMQDGKPIRMVGSLSMGDPGSIASRTADSLKLCFYGGGLSQAFQHDSASASGPAVWFPALP